MLQAGSPDPPPASPSSAGAERSRHFCPFLSRSRSRALCVRSPAPQGRRDRFRPRPPRGAARTGSPPLAGFSLLSPSLQQAPPPAQRQRAAARGGDALGSQLNGFPGLVGLKAGGWEKPDWPLGEFRRGTWDQNRGSWSRTEYPTHPHHPQMARMELGTARIGAGWEGTAAKDERALT